MWNRHTIQYYSVLKGKEILIDATMWMNSEDIMLSEMSLLLGLRGPHLSAQLYTGRTVCKGALSEYCRVALTIPKQRLLLHQPRVRLFS